MNQIDTFNLDQLKQMEATTEKSLRDIRDRREAIENDARDKRLETIKPLVVRAHGILCSWNHTDGCSWGYEMTGDQHNWRGWAHARWLRHWEELMLGTNERNPWRCTPDELTKTLDAIESLRKINPNGLYLIRQGICAP